jgi:hypothetical protein
MHHRLRVRRFLRSYLIFDGYLLAKTTLAFKAPSMGEIELSSGDMLPKSSCLLLWIYFLLLSYLLCRYLTYNP